MNSEYYSAVYTWFDKCGIISNVRTHLRQNLINALKGIKPSFSLRENTTPKSANQYVHDLLIAEYLWNRDYTYSLSVFASEVPLLVNFRDEPHASDSTDTNPQKLRDDYVCHTLETLGIRADSVEGQVIVDDYGKSNDPLLLCILKCLSSISMKKSKVIWYDRETQTTNDGYSKLVAIKKKLVAQKESFEKQLSEKENKLREQAHLVNQQLDLLNKKLEQAQALMLAVETKEKELTDEKRRNSERIFHKEMELSIKENFLTQESERLKKERNNYQRFESNLKKLQDELNKVKKDIPSNENNSPITQDVKVQTETEFSSIDEERKLLNKEKQELASLVREQKSRIEELTLRAVQLSRQLEEAHLIKSTTIDVPIIKANTIVSESSSTEDILLDAKMRLRRLEEESLRANQCYISCMTNSLQ
ncbi:uncharacterized protein PFB0145c [Cephus cinctus]|uniref:Uncharacterized protein PFB0145c n=1 Tax=Cephus cinctus TaxID=211228 RepID=A0AAJ7RIK0_CEPCN|nr:uncharacterized protein PFB0145c [Cephus cinctus]